jgi:hypothetical protein
VTRGQIMSLVLPEEIERQLTPKDVTLHLALGTSQDRRVTLGQAESCRRSLPVCLFHPPSKTNCCGFTHRSRTIFKSRQFETSRLRNCCAMISTGAKQKQIVLAAARENPWMRSPSKDASPEERRQARIRSNAIPVKLPE